MKIRCAILSVGVGLAAFLSASAGVAALNAQETACAENVSSVPTASVAETVPAEAEDNYLLRTVEGEICLFQNGQLILHTGVNVQLLPRQDREALEMGIIVSDQTELSALLEDFGS